MRSMEDLTNTAASTCGTHRCRCSPTSQIIQFIRCYVVSVCWPTVLTQGNAVKEIPKYAFEYARLGGTDPFQMLTDQQFADMIAEIEKYTCNDVTFEFDWVAWMSGDDASHYVYPRFMYNKPAGWNASSHFPGPSNISGLLRCRRQWQPGPLAGLRSAAL